MPPYLDDTQINIEKEILLLVMLADIWRCSVLYILSNSLGETNYETDPLSI